METYRRFIQLTIGIFNVFACVVILYGGWFVLFSPRNNATRKNEKTKRRHAKRRKDEITPCEKTKRRNNATRKDEITKPATRKVEIPTRKDEKTPRQKTPFKIVNLSSFRVELFVFFFVFSRGVISSFRLFAWRSFVFSHGVISSFRVASFRVSLFRLFAWCLFAWRLFA